MRRGAHRGFLSPVAHGCSKCIPGLSCVPTHAACNQVMFMRVHCCCETTPTYCCCLRMMTASATCCRVAPPVASHTCTWMADGTGQQGLPVAMWQSLLQRVQCQRWDGLGQVTAQCDALLTTMCQAHSHPAADRCLHSKAGCWGSNEQQPPDRVAPELCT